MERKMNKPLYKRELSHSYLVMENVPEELSGHYQYRMILRNRIPGLLSSSERYLEGRICLYYDISSRQSLEQLYLSARIGMKEIRGIIDNLAQVLDSMSEYLLEERFLILKPEYIFMDLETEQLFFLYYPFSEEKGNRYLPLAEFFLEHVDHREEKAVSTAYQFYKMSKAENFMVGSFRTLLEKGIQEEDVPDDDAAGREKTAWDPEGIYQKGGYRGGTGPKGIYQREAVQETWHSCGRADIRRKPAPAVCFREEEGPYEYRPLYEEEALEEEDPGKEPEEDTERETGKAGKAGRTGKTGKTEREGRVRWKAAAGLAASAVLFLLLCAVIWYLRPAGGKKVLLFSLLAADGLILLICLWKTTAQPLRKEEKEEELQKEEMPEDEADPFWEEYARPEHEELEGPTVYLSRGGMPGNEGLPAEKRPRLTGLSEDGKMQEYSLERLPVLVGKLKSRAQILLPDASVSRIHARFVDKGGRTAIIDLNSTNGTFVNDVRLEQEEVVVLEDGDELRFGNMRMKYQE